MREKNKEYREKYKIPDNDDVYNIYNIRPDVSPILHKKIKMINAQAQRQDLFL